MSSRGTIADAMATERRNTRGSAALGCDEKLAIAVAARNRRGHDACDAPAERPDEGGDVLADRGVNERIAHDALLCVASAGFELRLDQRQEMRRRPRECERRRQDELERDKAQIGRASCRARV